MVQLNTRTILVAFIGCLFSPLLARGDVPNKKDVPKFVEQFLAIKRETDDKLKPIYQQAEKDFEAAKTEVDRKKVMEALRSESDKIVAPAAQRVFDLVKPHAADPAAVELLVWVVSHRSNAETSSDVADLLMKHHLVRPETIKLAESVRHPGSRWVEAMLRAQFAAADLPQDQTRRVMWSLAMCLQQQAELCASFNAATEGELKRFNRLMGNDRVAEIKQRDAVKLEEEAIQLFTEAGVKYAQHEVAPGLTVGDIAKSSVFEIKYLSIGKTAPDIDGEDLDGVKFKLSEYRGKVIMLSFWATWCGPCMTLVPHEQELADLYKHRPFALIGVNADQEKASLKPALTKYQITWRSFWCGPMGPFGPIPRAWNVNGWPTIYLIDHAGVIRGKHLRVEALDAKIAELVLVAEKAAKKTPGSAMP